MHPFLAVAPVQVRRPPQEELREEGTKHPIHHRSGYPQAFLGPLNALVAPIKDSGMAPPGSSDHCPHVLGSLAAQWVITPIRPVTHLPIARAHSQEWHLSC